MTAPLYKKVGIASIVMMSSILLSRVMGLLREMVIAYAGGARGEVDAYQVAFILPEILNHVVASGFLSVTFIPIFNQYLARGQETEGWKIFSLILNTFGPFLVLLILLACYWTDPLISLVAPGMGDPVAKALAVRMTRIVLPAQLFFFIGALLMAVQFSKERFFIPALAPLLYNLGIILGGLVLAPWVGIEGFAWGVLAGAFAGNLVVQWIGARRAGMILTPGFDLSHPELRRYLFLTLPLVLGLTMTFSTEFFFRFFGSFMPQGTVAALNYGLRVTLILVGLFGQALGTASYPFMSRLAAEGRMDEMMELMNRTLRYLSLVIPLSVLLMVLRYEVVFLLFQRGRFDAAATELTAHVLPFLLVGAFAFSAQTIVVRGFYALQDTIFPALFGTGAVLLSIPFYVLGINVLGPAGVAIGVSLSALLQVIVLFALWNRRTGNPASGRVYGFVGRVALLSMALGVILEAFRRTLLMAIVPESLRGNLLSALATTLLFGLVLFLGGRALGVREIPDALQTLIRKVTRHASP